MIKPYLRRLKALANIAADAAYDARRYFRFSQSGRSDLTENQIKGRLLQKAHSIEKGLAMSDVRAFFGKSPLQELDRLLLAYDAKGFAQDHVSRQKALSVLRAYRDHHVGRDLELPDDLDHLTRRAGDANGQPAGIKTIDRAALFEAAAGDLESVMKSRHSIRAFADAPVDPEAIQRAVALAQTSPSVCNRQSARVYVVRDPALKEQALKLQGGNRGFGHQLDSILVVTSDLGTFRDSRERNRVSSMAASSRCP